MEKEERQNKNGKRASCTLLGANCSNFLVPTAMDLDRFMVIAFINMFP